jgi:hypothetical protein
MAALPDEALPGVHVALPGVHVALPGVYVALPLASRWPLWSRLPRPPLVPGILAGFCVVDPGLVVDPVHGGASSQL